MDHLIHPIQNLDDISRLLQACALPVADVAEAPHLVFFGVHEGAGLSGVIGLERYGNVALLRSLAVSPEARGQGLGRALVAHAERQAREAGVERLYLLTTTAADFFARLGYSPADRAAAPPAIRDTAQFSALCPSTSAFMVKLLA